MTLFALLIVLAIEFHFKIGSEYRQFSWFEKSIQFFQAKLGEKTFYQSWWKIGIILLAPVFVLFGFTSLFDGMLYSLILLIVSIPILFFSLGPRSLEESFSDYFSAMEREDTEAAVLHFNEIGASIDKSRSEPKEKDELVRAATLKLLTEAQKRYFGPIVWFIFAGPFGALFYRLSHYYSEYCQKHGIDEESTSMLQLIHWVDWIPARITSLLFLLTGDFVKGFYPIQDYLMDAEADNNQLVSDTGLAALGLERGISDESLEENYRAYEIDKRTLIFYLVLAAIVSTIS